MRFEFKYLVPIELLPRLRAAIIPYVDPDEHNRGSHGYTVRSIYFDTATLGCYHDTQVGLPLRRKVRIRGYNERRESNTVFLEVKRKHGMAVVKSRAPVAYAHVKDLFASGDIERYITTDANTSNAIDDARGFLFYVYRGSLRPIILVVYEREAYCSKFDSLRITFDKNLRSSISPSMESLFHEDSTHYSIPKHAILELKFSGGLPSWVKSTVGTFSAKRQSFSKYNICLDEHQATNGLHNRSTIPLFFLGNVPFGLEGQDLPKTSQGPPRTVRHSLRPKK